MAQISTSLRSIGTQTEISGGVPYFVTEFVTKPGSLENCDHVKVLNLKMESSGQSQNLFTLLNSLPAAAAVLSISKIRSKIFSYSSPQDLLNFRLVPRQWRLDATNSTLLQWKQNTISIVVNQTLSGQDVFAENCKRNLKVPIEELSALLNKTGMNPFPCNLFFVVSTNESEICDGKIKAFFRDHGFRIVALQLDLSYYKTCGENIQCSHGEFWLQNFFEDHIVRQLPNLEAFDIRPSIEKLGFWTHSENYCNPNITQIFENSVQTINYNLKSVKIWWRVSESFLESICGSAPNLKQLELTHLKLYLEPKNRLQFLKNINYDICSSPYSVAAVNNEIIKRIANDAVEALQLTELSFHLEFIYEPSEAWLEEEAETCNKLLRKSCRSLRKLKWAPLGFLPGLIIPQMPNINYISFQTGWSGSPDGSFFPQDINISETFPNLRTVEISLTFDEAWFKCGDFLRLGCQVVPSVNEIINKSSAILNGIQQWFPNAKAIS